jgi:hypothetical protein
MREAVDDGCSYLISVLALAGACFPSTPPCINMAPSRSARTTIVTSSFAIYNLMSGFLWSVRIRRKAGLGAQLLPTFAIANAASC